MLCIGGVIGRKLLLLERGPKAVGERNLWLRRKSHKQLFPLKREFATKWKSAYHFVTSIFFYYSHLYFFNKCVSLFYSLVLRFIL